MHRNTHHFRHQVIVIWLGSLLLVAISHIMLSTLDKHSNQSQQRFVLFLLNPTLVISLIQSENAIELSKRFFYLLFPLYATFLSPFAGTQSFRLAIRWIVGFHLLLAITGAVVVLVVNK